MRRWKNVYHANANEKQARVSILISNKIDLKTKTITRDKGGHYIMIKRSIQEENTIEIYVPIIKTPKYIKQILTDIKGEIDSKMIIIRDFNTPLTSMDRSSRWKTNKETLTLNNTLVQMSLIEIYIEHPIKRSIHILFRCSWNSLQDR